MINLSVSRLFLIQAPPTSSKLMAATCIQNPTGEPPFQGKWSINSKTNQILIEEGLFSASYDVKEISPSKLTIVQLSTDLYQGKTYRFEKTVFLEK